MKKMKATKRKARSVMEDVRGPRRDELFGFLAGEVRNIGDIESPIFPRRRWEREQATAATVKAGWRDGAVRNVGGAGDAGGSETPPRGFEGGGR